MAYARSPPTLSELAEASIIDLSSEGSIQVDDRGGLQDTLEILGELVTCGKSDDNDDNDDDDNDYDDYDDDISDAEGENESEDENPNNDNLYATWSGRRVS